MGDYYDFAFQEVEGFIKSGYVYKNQATGWHEVFVEFTDSQRDFANSYVKKLDNLEAEKQKAIMLWTTK